MPVVPAASLPRDVSTAVDAQLLRFRPFAFPPALQRLYDERTTESRQRDTSFVMLAGAVFSLSAIFIDHLNGPLAFRLGLPVRLGAAIIAALSGLVLRRRRGLAVETLAIFLSATALIGGFHVLAQLNAAREASRYAMTGLFLSIFANLLLPLRIFQGLLIALLGAIALPVIVLTIPGTLQLQADADVTVGAVPAILLGLGLMLRQESLRRQNFLRILKAQMDAEALARSNAELARLSVTDPLTGLANRRRFDAAFDAYWAERQQRSLGVALIDVDHFKLFNDAAGHAAGDVCLQRIASVIAGCVRGEGDCVARYGGEEFAVLIPGTGHVELGAIAERLRRAVENAAIAHPGRDGAAVTISIGAAWLPVSSRATSPGEVMRLADAALYAAKEAGRNRAMLRLLPS